MSEKNKVRGANWAAPNGRATHWTKLSTPRMVAEWVTLSISLLLLVSIAGFLVIEMLRGDGPYAAVEVIPQWGKIQRRQDLYILPIEIRNRGYRTLRDLEVRVAVKQTDAGEQDDERTVKIDYLGEGSAEVVYLYFDKEPTAPRMVIRPLYYRAD